MLSAIAFQKLYTSASKRFFHNRAQFCAHELRAACTVCMGPRRFLSIAMAPHKQQHCCRMACCLIFRRPKSHKHEDPRNHDFLYPAYPLYHVPYTLYPFLYTILGSLCCSWSFLASYFKGSWVILIVLPSCLC